MSSDAARLLALDTATEACSAAVYIGGEILSRYREAPRGHAQAILPMIDSLLAEAGLRLGDLNAIAFGRGPGSFTGLRIAAGTVQGLAWGADLPVVPVSTLATLAQGAGHDRVLAAIDARMQEVYWGQYRRGQDGVMQPEAQECVTAPARVVCPNEGDWWGVGTGWGSYGEILRQRCGAPVSRLRPDALPHAANMIPLARQAWRRGEAVRAEQAMPVYLRNQVAKRPDTAGPSAGTL